MVWSLFPVDPLSGEDKYYIFLKGTFKVGRKGCDIIVKKDKGVSRVHAEIIVDAMTSTGPVATSSPNVRIRDLSKYGTFTNKNLGSEEKVHNKESTLRDGDVVSFGTGNAIYRFSFVPLAFLVLCSESSQVNDPLLEKLSSIGASTVKHLNQECTHVLVDQFAEVNESLLDAIAMKKPLVLSSWVEAILEKSIGTEIPSCSGHIPLLALKGTSVKVADPKTRENCLKGYTFLLVPVETYKFGHKLQILLDVAGAKRLSIDDFCSTSQGSEDLDNNRVVYVIPGGSRDNSISRISLQRVEEMDLLRAILCGHLDSSSLRAPPVVVSSSCSTDETIVADSEVEDETSKPLQEEDTVHMEEAIKNNEKVMPNRSALESENVHRMEETTENREDVLRNHSVLESENVHSIHEEKASPKNTDGCAVIRRDKIGDSDMGTSDIIYTQDIIVRNTNVQATSSDNFTEVNFKRFRKMQTPSGNSFNNLVPFSKFPYKDSEYGNEEVAESVKEEKRRKQLEAMAEDLFNNERGRKRGFAGSLHGLLTRG